MNFVKACFRLFFHWQSEVIHESIKCSEKTLKKQLVTMFLISCYKLLFHCKFTAEHHLQSFCSEKIIIINSILNSVVVLCCDKRGIYKGLF